MLIPCGGAILTTQPLRTRHLGIAYVSVYTTKTVSGLWVRLQPPPFKGAKRIDTSSPHMLHPLMCPAPAHRGAGRAISALHSIRNSIEISVGIAFFFHSSFSRLKPERSELRKSPFVGCTRSLFQRRVFHVSISCIVPSRFCRAPPRDITYTKGNIKAPTTAFFPQPKYALRMIAVLPAFKTCANFDLQPTLCTRVYPYSCSPSCTNRFIAAVYESLYVIHPKASPSRLLYTRMGKIRVVGTVHPVQDINIRFDVFGQSHLHRSRFLGPPRGDLLLSFLRGVHRTTELLHRKHPLTRT